jgi:hypothetical protein
VYRFQSATICSRWTTQHRGDWQNPVGSIDFGGNVPATVAAVLWSIADDQIQILKNTYGHDFISWHEKLDVAAQPDTLRTRASENEVVKQETTPLGLRLVVEGAAHFVRRRDRPVWECEAVKPVCSAVP